MKKIFTYCVGIACTQAICMSALAQPSLGKLKERLQTVESAAEGPKLLLNPQKKQQATLFLGAKSQIRASEAQQWLASRLQLRAGKDELRELRLSTQTQAGQIEKFQQYYKGIKVEHGQVNSLTTGDFSRMMEMEFYTIPDDFNTTPTIAEEQALQAAMTHMGAQRYVWEGYTGPDKHRQRPKASLVIINDYRKDDGTVALAYKFSINASAPHASAFVYIDAKNGGLILMDNQLHSAYGTEVVSAKTKYSGTQDLSTDLYDPLIGADYYRLRTTRNGHDIETYNFRYNEPTGLDILYEKQFPTDFTSTTKPWAGTDDTATEAHFNMQLVSDFLKDRLGRNSYDNKNATITGFVHAKTGSNLAFWEPNHQVMMFGDGEMTGGGFNNIKSTGPDVGLDVAAHEIGHAMMRAEDMPKLVYARESGALNEAFSDIWGICAENYAIVKFPALAPNKSIWLLGEESITMGGTKGVRDFINPKIKGLPDTYYGANYMDASLAGCATPSQSDNDYCGVHTNSGILGKWFSLITAGGSGTNDNGYAYSVTGLGFDIAEQIAYNTQLLLTPNSNYHAAMHASLNFTQAKFGSPSEELTQVTAAWRAVGLLDSMFFDNNHFTALRQPGEAVTEGFFTVAVGKDGQVWAGTSREGLYRYNDSTGWRISTVALDNRLNYLDMKTDQFGGVWMAQSGYNAGASNPNSSGGIFYFADTAFEKKYEFRPSAENNPPRNTLSNNMRSIWVDVTRTNDSARIKRGKNLPMVWAVSLPHIRSGSQTSGGLTWGLYDTITRFTPCPACPEQAWDSNFVRHSTPYLDSVDRKTQQRGAQVIGGNKDEVWVYSDANTEKSLTAWGYGSDFPYNGSPRQIMRFNAQTGDSIGVYNSSNVPLWQASFNVKAIYLDKHGNKWIGLTGNDVLVQDKDGNWHRGGNVLPTYNPDFPAGTFPSIFPSNTTVNNHAIVGDDTGNVYMGTTAGLVVYSGGPVNDYTSYTRYTTQDGLPSNNIRAIAIDTLRKGLWLATDKGVVLWRLRGPMYSLHVQDVAPDLCGRDLSFSVQMKGKYYTNPFNDLIVELSDANGNFASSTILEQRPQISNRWEPLPPIHITKTLPLSIPDGDNYRLRARTTSPVFVGSVSRPFAIKKTATTVPSNGAKAITADWECDDMEGWTHYYNSNGTWEDESDDIRLLSIKKGSNDIGSLSDGTVVTVAATPLAGSFSAQSLNNNIITNKFVSMNRYWEVKPHKQPSSPVGVRFYYNTQDLQDLNGGLPYTPINHQQMVLYKTDGNPNPSSNLLGATVILSYTNSNAPSLTEWVYTQLKDTIHQAEFLVAGFSGGGAGSTQDNGPLTSPVTPLTLLGFEGSRNGAAILLQWLTANEQNTSHFEISRSTDGIVFATIASKPAMGSGGHQYNIADANAPTSTVYYRLRMVDKDGTSSYSQIIRLGLTNQLQVSIQPNPVHGTMQVLASESIKAIRVSDISGRVLRLFAPQANNRYNMQGIAPGVYVVSCETKNGVTTQKVLVR